MEKKICKWKRLIACLCAMAMVLVLPVPVLAESSSDVGVVSDGVVDYSLTKSQERDGWSYDAASKTLSLNGVDAAKNLDIEWYSDTALTIILNGNNGLGNIAGEYRDANMEAHKTDIIIKGSGTLSVSRIEAKHLAINGGSIVCPSIFVSEFEMNDGNLDITVKVDEQGYRTDGIHCYNFVQNGGKISVHGNANADSDYSLCSASTTEYKGDASFLGGEFTSEFAPMTHRVLTIGDNMELVSGTINPSRNATNGDKIIIKQKGSAVPVTPAYTSKTGEKLDQWAQEGVNKAIDAGLMPECLKNTDLTKNITRAQFAALAVTLYEKMGGESVSLDGVTNPFTDTQDSEVLKAYALGITTGTSSTAFSPNSELTREAAATMLLRVYSKLGGKVEYKIEPFADDVRISDWAKEAVYFMADKEIVNGVGDNNFNPKGNAQSQQTLIIALRMLDNLSV